MRFATVAFASNLNHTCTLLRHSPRSPRSSCHRFICTNAHDVPHTRACASTQPSSVKLAASTALFHCKLSPQGRPNFQVLLVKRGKPPNLHLWALPGGSVNADEPLLQAAARELYEETKLSLCDVTYIPEPFHIHKVAIPNSTMSYHIHVFCAILQNDSCSPIASDDALQAQFYNMPDVYALNRVSSLDYIVRKGLILLNSKNLKPWCFP